MKIYNKIVIDIATNEVLEEDSFEYDGEVSLCKGSTIVEAPKPSAEEIALQQAQLEILQQQQTDTEAMRPYVLQGMGLIEEDGEYRYMTEDEKYASMSTLEQAQYNLTKTEQERLAQAYAGELPISPALEESLQKQEAQMAEALSQRLGSNWMQTTAGQQAMSGFTQKADLLREEARRGAITGEGGLLLSNLGYLGNTEAQQTSFAANFPSRTSGLFGSYGQAQQPYQYYSGMEFQANATNAQNSAARQAGLMSGLGAVAGSALMAGGIAL